MTVLVTGGAGYIGSHATKRLLKAGHDVVVVDNLSRGNRGAVDLLSAMAGGRLTFVEADLADRPAVERALRDLGVDRVLHFAALAYVRESAEQPLLYHRNNYCGSLSLLEACDAAGVKKFVFSSTCATYGEQPPDRIPITEDAPTEPVNPYGWSKLNTERALRDYAASRKAQGRPFAWAALRYFNVAGADREGVLGEWHTPETHIIPIALEVAAGKREAFTVLGDDHPTPDGTCVRDYIHVDDLVEAHAQVLDSLDPGGQEATRGRIYNLGTGKPFSVREVLDAVRRVTGRDVPEKPAPRHPADPPTLTADATKIAREIGWEPEVTELEDMIESAWTWFREHPDGYE